ncbi:helix-turn-helix domain-containing protein [Umezawaea sp. Da 62-37]|uniref:helix-turn-helix domain-containing protein n=1 Tax=Umezawaea sp. Da 62-37 TaxID=3075927 RepID=UPI0037DD6D60
MRYGDGDGVCPQGRVRREQIRRRAAMMFADGISAVQIATALEVSTTSAYTWRRAWLTGGEQALVSRGAPGPNNRLSQTRVQRVEDQR